MRRAVLGGLVACSAAWAGALVWAPTVCYPPRQTADAQPQRVAASLVYLAGSRVCHQREDRSFTWDGCPMPVCGRCAGLYLAAPAGLVVAGLRRRRPVTRARRVLLLSTVPTAVTLAAEWTGAVPVGSLTRAVAALPLGLVVGWLAGAAVTGDLR